MKRLLAVIAVLIVATGVGRAGEPKPDTSRGDQMIARYFEAETQRLTAASLADIKTLGDWNDRKDEYRRQLFEMLALDPLPAKTPLKPVVTGTVDHDEFRVENLHFQSRPGLYVTGNLYIPKKRKGKLPTILYVCGHGRVKKDGISYGNKTHYQHHGAWFARNGYACLIIDTLQLGNRGHSSRHVQSRHVVVERTRVFLGSGGSVELHSRARLSGNSPRSRCQPFRCDRAIGRRRLQLVDRSTR